MKTRFLLVVAMMAAMFAGAGSLSAQAPVASFELEKVMGSIQYPAFAIERGIEGVVNVSFDLDEAGSIAGLTVWGNDPRLASYVERQLKWKTRRMAQLPLESADGAYRLVFRMNDSEPVIVPFDQIIRNEMLALEGNSLLGTANVMVQTNEAGMVEDIRVWGRNSQLVAQLEARLNKLSGQTVDSAGGETTLRYRLVMK